MMLSLVLRHKHRGCRTSTAQTSSCGNSIIVDNSFSLVCLNINVILYKRQINFNSKRLFGRNELKEADFWVLSFLRHDHSRSLKGLR